MNKLILNLKNYAGKNWQLIALAVSVLLLILSYAGCGSKKSDNKELQTELDKCKSMYEALDTAHFKIITQKAALEAQLQDLTIPDPLVIEKDANQWQINQLREQVQRNKLKQVELIGDRLADSLAFELAIKERDNRISDYEVNEKDLIDNLNKQTRQLSVLENKLTARLYKDTVTGDDYTARYEATTEGILKGFKLAVDTDPVIVERTVLMPAPPAQRYRYKNYLSLKYTPSSTWNNKYDIYQKAGVEYERNMGVLKARLNYDYQIENKDHEVSASVLLTPARWGKKVKE